MIAKLRGLAADTAYRAAYVAAGITVYSVYNAATTSWWILEKFGLELKVPEFEFARREAVKPSVTSGITTVA